MQSLKGILEAVKIGNDIDDYSRFFQNTEDTKYSFC